MKKALVLIITLALLFSVAGCNDYYERDDDSPRKTRSTTSTTKYITLEEWYADVDLSQFSRHGRSTENDAMWVEKSDYTGTQYGCINTKGEWIVPLTPEIVSIFNSTNYDFSEAGLSVVVFSHNKRKDFEDTNDSGSFYGIYNSKGEIVGIFEGTGRTLVSHLNNGNVFLFSIRLYGGDDASCYMFCASNNQFVQMPEPCGKTIYSLEYSDGLMLLYSNDRDSRAKYYDENGNCCIDLENSNPYYREVKYADDFVDGQANVNFIGQDGEWYTVKINKKGEWINEPTPISQYDSMTWGHII